MNLFSEYRQVNQLLGEKQELVFYAESRHYFQYFEKLIRDLLATQKVNICYITSDKADPLLRETMPGMRVVFVKWMLGFLFARLHADMMILTMPDLDNFLFKRSKNIGTYVYVFHAAVSTHLQYRQKAFFNYDAVFCTGPYQVNEIRKAEQLYSQHPKELIAFGYPLFDSLLQKTRLQNNSGAGKEKTILIAPSWFEDCIFETCIEELLAELVKLPYTIIVRTHPEYEKRKKKEYARLQKLVNRYDSLFLDKETNVLDRLPQTDILVTDRSGIALEFAIGCGRPVLFIDTPLKQTNPRWRELELEPLENSLRPRIGLSLLPGELNLLASKIRELENFSQGFRERMETVSRESFYPLPASTGNGLRFILQKLGKG
ncbi:MAG TPA: CDP-glycerol glycerophosphotransferase family protein [Chitinophagaceae bacterium]|nr:CDP-glycerol glycerophosphotransferase family protein [Chitinophagaceae bacterium]